MGVAAEAASTLFADRVALITGGARGIGLALARHLAGRGARVVVMDNGASIDGRERDAQAPAAAADALGDQAMVVDADVGDAQAVAAVMDRIATEHGRLDILIHAAAIMRDALIAKIAPEDFAEVLRVNLAGGLVVMRAGLPLLRRAAEAEDASGREPAVLNLVSSAAFYGNVGVAAYAAAKAGLMALTRVGALEFRRFGIRVNALMPFAATRVTEAIPPVNPLLESYRARALTIPPETVAPVAAWLVSPFARGITGQLVGVRGRRVFLMSQPRPVAEAIVGRTADEESVDRAARAAFAGRWTDLASDLEAFNLDPLI
ncbi:MAG: 3-hydroxyacyl-CoA dehydrogenase [Rhodothalassiaceae bacterium]|nr:MAG: 3-hydroxyacyl-CoA dehydrogenase [Rhodothalassiaceae bacterium]